MHVANHVDGDVLRNVQGHQAVLFREDIVRGEDDLPDVAFRQRLAILEPLDHGTHEFESDRVFPIFILRELGPSVALVEVAAAWS